MTAPGEPADASRAGDEILDVVVIGGSQAGLAMAWHLARHHLRFVVLEAGPEIGHTWRSRWDSLTLFTPAQYDALPGMPFPGPPDTYPTKDPVAGYLQGLRGGVRPAGQAERPGHRPEPDGGGLRDPDRRRCLPRPPGGGGDRAVPGALRAAGRAAAGRLGDPAAQRRVPQPAGPAVRAGAGRRRRQLRVPDRRRTRRDPPGRPVDRHQGAGAAAAARGQGPVLVAHPAGADAGHRRVPAGPPDVRPGVHHRQQPPPAEGGRGPVPARSGRRGRAHRPVRRRHQPGRRRW